MENTDTCISIDYRYYDLHYSSVYSTVSTFVCFQSVCGLSLFECKPNFLEVSLDRNNNLPSRTTNCMNTWTNCVHRLQRFKQKVAAAVVTLENAQTDRMLSETERVLDLWAAPVEADPVPGGGRGDDGADEDDAGDGAASTRSKRRRVEAGGAASQGNWGAVLDRWSDLERDADQYSQQFDLDAFVAQQSTTSRNASSLNSWRLSKLVTVFEIEDVFWFLL